MGGGEEIYRFYSMADKTSSLGNSVIFSGSNLSRNYTSWCKLFFLFFLQ